MMVLDSASIVADIEAHAEAAGISINALCRLAGVSRSTFTRMKSGVTAPTVRIIARLQGALPPSEEAA